MKGLMGLIRFTENNKDRVTVTLTSRTIGTLLLSRI